MSRVRDTPRTPAPLRVAARAITCHLEQLGSLATRGSACMDMQDAVLARPRRRILL